MRLVPSFLRTLLPFARVTPVLLPYAPVAFAFRFSPCPVDLHLPLYSVLWSPFLPRDALLVLAFNSS